MCRLRCRLTGCYTGDFPCCERRGTYSEDPGFVSRGVPCRVRWRLRRLWQQVWPVRRCQHCGKLLFYRRRWPDGFCSGTCFDKWLPF